MTINSFAAMPIQNLKRAVAIREKIDALEEELDKLTGIPTRIPNGDGNGHAAKVRGITVKQHGLSTAGRARIAAAQRMRWMRFRIEHGNGSTNGSAHNSQRLSPEGRARVSAAVKARWERYRAAKARNTRHKS